MTTNEVIYVTKPSQYVERNYPGYARFFGEFYAQLREYHEVRALDLPDIWVRDFFPVQNVQTGKLTQLFFNPSYANYVLKFTGEIRRQVRALFPQAKRCNVRMDGGNIVLTPDKKYALCLEKQTICCKSDFAQKAQTERALIRALGVDKILWIPHQIGDKIGHIDGYIQFLGHTLMEGSIDDDVTTVGLLDRRGQDALHHYWTTQISVPNICFPDMPREIYDYWNEKIPEGGYLNRKWYDIWFPHSPYWVHLICRPDKRSWLSARGLYVNFLETSRAVFVPQFGLPEDSKAFSIIKRCTSKPVVRVDCSKIAEYGGAVHCLTREYDEKLIS